MFNQRLTRYFNTLDKTIITIAVSKKIADTNNITGDTNVAISSVASAEGAAAPIMVRTSA